MKIIPNIHITAMTIFFGTILLTCIKANSDNLTSSAIETESPTMPHSHYLVSTSPDEAADIDPLPESIFSAEVSDFLSPDIFTQANLFDYFFKKAKKLPFTIVREINNRMWYILPREQFPQRYVPYAEFASSLLPCVLHLKDIEESTRNIQRFMESNRVTTPPNIFNQDPLISPLLSSYVFSDKNPPLRLLHKLIEIPENEISSLSIRVQKLLNHRHFPRQFSRYTKCLLAFLKMKTLLLHLKTSIVEIQRVITSSIPQSEHDSNSLQIDDELDLQTEHQDSSAQAQLINESENGSTVAAGISNNDLDANPLPRKIFKREVRNFLSSDIFSQSDPYSFFLAKAMKLPDDVLRQIHHHLAYSLDRDEFPQRYIPYAELAESLLSCLIPLEKVEQFMCDKHCSNPYDYCCSRRVPILDIDPELSKLFAWDILFKANSSARILNKLLDIPDDEISSYVTRLQNFLKNNKFSTRIYRYGHYLMEFLHHEYLLLRLKDNIKEIQRVLTSNLTTSDQPNLIAFQE